ncbi:MAG: hypothetical protein ACI8PT_003637 [Gammaproteobacteria bacterium]|jgi:hypothetical protein
MPSNSASAATRLVVFSDDWGRHPSSSQHLIGKLLADYDVVWVNTIGTRMPRLSLEDAQKIYVKLRQWTQPADTAQVLPARLSVLNPKMFPGFRQRWQRRVNAVLVSRALDTALGKRHSGERRIGITTLPLTAGLIGRVDVDSWLYYCVDDFSVWPGLDGDVIDAMERDLVAKVDKVIAVSTTLQQRMAAMGKQAQLLTHGIDLDHWGSGLSAGLLDSEMPRPQSHDSQAPDGHLPGTDLPGVDTDDDTKPTCASEQPSWWPSTGPVLLFWGVVDKRLDVAWCRALANEVGSLVLVGPHQSPDPSLLAIPGITLPGPIAYAQLPALARCADVLVMPYDDLPVTRAMQPLKLKEYLATGRPSIVRSLPSTRGWDDTADVIESIEDLVRVARERCANGIPMGHTEARARRLRGETWAAKARAFEATFNV